MMKIFLILILLVVESEATCGGFLFLGGTKNSTCDHLVPFFQVIRDVSRDNLPDDGNGFAIRRFGGLKPGFAWESLIYTYRDEFLKNVEEWIDNYPSSLCDGLTDDGITYTEPLTDLLDHLKTNNYSGYGVFLMGNTDANTDLQNATDIARQIAEISNADIYVWDFSLENSNDLFEILTSGRSGHILRKRNLSYSELYQFVASAMIPEFSNIACGNVTSFSSAPITTPAISSPTPPPTNTSCTSLELIFILDRSESIIPSIYDSNVSQFVLDFAGQFSFPDEASSGSGYARFGVIQFADTAEISVPLGNYTRNNFINQVKQKIKFGDGGVNNIVGALLAAYDQFNSNSVLSNRAVILVVDDVSTSSIEDALDVIAHLETLVDLPMGVIIPGFAGTPEEGLTHLKILLGNNSKLVFPDLSTALSNAPSLITDTFPCSIPAVCSVLCFIEEASTAIGAEAKLNFLKLIQRLVNTVAFNPHQRFSISFFGESIYKSIEPQMLSVFNSTLSSFIETISADNSPNGGRTFLAPILNQYTATVNSNLYQKFSAVLLAETEVIRDPIDTYSACQALAALNTDFYVIDQSRFIGPSSLFPTCTGNKHGHVLNGTSLSQDQLFNQLRDSLIQTFNSLTC